MSTEEMYNIIEDYFGHKARMIHCSPEVKEAACILYDSFYLVCNINDRYGRFGAGIAIGGEAVLTKFLGKRCSLSSDEKSIRESLQIIDEYCRLRLPDKFLEAYDAAYHSKK